jgi:uncharacterized protein (TIGR03437 family)
MLTRIAVLAALIPFSAWADLSVSVNLPGNEQFSLETGTVVAAGDFTWNGNALTPQGNAFATGPGVLGPAVFSGSNAALQLLLEQNYYSGLYSQKPVTGVGVGTLIGMLDNSGNFAALLITDVSPSTLSFQLKTFGTPGSVPSISSIQNNYSYILPGLPNSGIAPGALFIIKGSDLSAIAPGPITLQSSAAPGLPATLHGASISVTVNGVTTHPPIYYSIATQIAAVLPSATPAGTGTLTVSYNGVPSAPAPITVVPTALGLDTLDGSGTGTGVATDLSYNLISYAHPATPLQDIVLWGSGLGADPADSDTTVTSTPHAVNVPLAIYIGGLPAQILYQGASGFPGLNQINVQVPGNVAPGCGVSVVAVSGGVVSNTITLPVSAQGIACSDPMLGLTGAQLAAEVNGYPAGSLTVTQTVNNQTAVQSIQTVATGTFEKVYSASGVLSLGSCTVAYAAIPSGAAIAPGTGLDAGALTISGPGGTFPLSDTLATGFYSATLANSIFPQTGTTFHFDATGGADVSAFSASVSYGAPPLWTNQSGLTSITRASGQTITWSGGPANTYMAIGGSSSTATATAAFTCYAPVAAGQFTIPAYILEAMPAQGGGGGTLTFANYLTPQPFAAQGLSSSTVSAGLAVVAGVSYQE